MSCLLTLETLSIFVALAIVLLAFEFENCFVFVMMAVHLHFVIGSQGVSE